MDRETALLTRERRRLSLVLVLVSVAPVLFTLAIVVGLLVSSSFVVGLFVVLLPFGFLVASCCYAWGSTRAWNGRCSSTLAG